MLKKAKASEAPTLASTLMGAGSVAYSSARDRISSMSTVFTNVGGNAARPYSKRNAKPHDRSN